jgi:lysozyme family protein
MQPSFESLSNEYARLWQGMKIHDDKIQIIDKIARRLASNKSRYQAVTQMTTVPWFVVAVLHEREASANFLCHLHNGDPLSARTRHVPSGRPPPPANPPFTWEQSACDALELDGLSKVASWSTERICYEIELYNGFGYRRHGINSPYLWSFSNNYSAGKYVADGKWSTSAVDAQCGVMPLISRLMATDSSIAFESSAPARAVAASPGVTALSSPGEGAGSTSAHTTEWLQRSLNSLGASPKLVVDGRYGPSTKKLVRQFQAANELLDDGIAGPATYAAIEKELRDAAGANS